jgi:hypothetical protein
MKRNEVRELAYKYTNEFNQYHKEKYSAELQLTDYSFLVELFVEALINADLGKESKMSQKDYEPSIDYDNYDASDEVISTPFCGICDTQLAPKTDDYYPDRIWFTCPICKEAIEKNSDLESLVATLEEKWLKAERMYHDLQDHIKTIIS